MEIDKVTKRATAVQFMRNNQMESVRANKEIILSGGSVGSAQILMLSGVGPMQHLKSVGVGMTDCKWLYALVVCNIYMILCEN